MACIGLVEYSSSDSSEEETPAKEEMRADISKDKPGLNKLPVPTDIHKLFSENSRSKLDNPADHEGRIRSFPHEAGNWATSVFLPVEFADDIDFLLLQEKLINCLKPLEFHKMTHCHISLSRTVTIRHHWIQDMKSCLEKEFSFMLPCACEITGIKIYVNDERTRSFLGLQVVDAENRLEEYVQIVDGCFDSYNLAKYYRPPSFHISIGWCIGDVTANISKITKQKMKEVLQNCCAELDNGGYFVTEAVVLKTGNKEFVFKVSKSL